MTHCEQANEKDNDDSKEASLPPIHKRSAEHGQATAALHDVSSVLPLNA